MRSVLIVALALAGCGGAPPGTPAMQLELGAPSANGQMAPLPDGSDVTLVAGAQGGFHVWLDYRVAGLGPGTQTLERRAHRASDGQLVLRMSTDVEIGAAGPDGFWQPDGPIPMFMCPSPVGLSVIDQPIVLELSLPGAGLSREVTVVPHCPAEEEDFCVRICSG